MALLEWLKNILSHQDGHLIYLISQKEVTLIRTAISFFCKNNGEILVSLTLIWFISVFHTFWLVKMFYKEKIYTCTAPVLKGEIITMDEDETLLTWFRKHSFFTLHKRFWKYVPWITIYCCILYIFTERIAIKKETRNISSCWCYCTLFFFLNKGDFWYYSHKNIFPWGKGTKKTVIHEQCMLTKRYT